MPDYIVDTDTGAITFTSQTKIVFKVGDNTLTLDANGLTVKAMNIQEKAELSHTIEATQGAIKAAGGLKLQSAQINVTPG